MRTVLRLQQKAVFWLDVACHYVFARYLSLNLECLSLKIVITEEKVKNVTNCFYAP